VLWCPFVYPKFRYCYSNNRSIVVLLYIGDKYDKHVAIFFFFVIQMQLAEYFMWQDQSCGDTNKYATIYAYIVLLMQPLSVLWAGYYFRTLHISLQMTTILSIVFIIVYGRGIVEYLLKPGTKCSRPRVKHLEWDFTKDTKFTFENILYFILLFIPWLFLKNKQKGILVFSFSIASFVYHYIKYKDDWLSLWCYITRNMAILYAIFALYWKYK